MVNIAALEKLLDGPRDNAMLRLTLAKQLADLDKLEDAIRHLQVAVSMQEQYSAAWKLLGKCLALNGANEQAQEAYRQGIVSAQAQGDKQSEKEMRVFLKRLDK